MAGKSKIESLRAQVQRAKVKYAKTQEKLDAAKAKHDESTQELAALTSELQAAEVAKRAELEAELAELTPASV